MINMTYTGFHLIDEQLRKWQKLSVRKLMEQIGEEGVELFREATPKRTGRTADSWRYEIRENNKTGWMSLVWLNSNFNDGVNIAIMIQLGHGTPRGKYVPGVDYINPVLDQLYKKFGEQLVGEVIWS